MKQFRKLCSWLGSLLVLIRNVNSKLLQAEEWSSSSWRIVVNMSANASDCPANKAVEKAIVEKGLGKKHGQYFIFMVALDAASSFVLFHAGRCLELLEWCVGNFGIKKFSLCQLQRKFFNTKIYNMIICSTNIFRFTVIHNACILYVWCKEHLALPLQTPYTVNRKIFTVKKFL